MKILRLRLNGWRNWRSAELEFHPQMNVFWGGNGQGKTNLLEALYYLIHLSSFRTRKHAELIGWEADRGRLEAVCEIMGVPGCRGVEIGGSGRTVSVEGAVVSDSIKYFNGLCGVWFGPGQIDLVFGAPSVRRKYLDRVAFRRSAGHLQIVRDFLKVLHSRNVVLKENRRSLLHTYSVQLAAAGARLTAARMDALRVLEGHIGPVHHRLSGGHGTVTVEYRSAWNPDGVMEKDDLEEIFLNKLTHTLERDQKRGFTGSGPHTDDVLFAIDGRSARRFASQGQVRTLAVTLTVSEFHMMRQEHGESPVFLMDDLSSELDKTRRELLLDHLLELTGQLFVTTTSLDFLPVHVPRGDWHIVGGATAT